MATDKPRFSLTLDEKTMDRVLEYQKQHGLSTKSRAIQALVESGLQDYIETSPDPEGPRDEKEALFMELFGRLTDDHKRFLIAVMKVLLEQGR